MKGPQHWEEADKILTVGDPCSYGCPHTGCPHEMAMIGRAIAHALLALGDLAMLSAVMGLEERDEWDRATGRMDSTEVTP